MIYYSLLLLHIAIIIASLFQSGRGVVRGGAVVGQLQPVPRHAAAGTARGPRRRARQGRPRAPVHQYLQVTTATATACASARCCWDSSRAAAPRSPGTTSCTSTSVSTGNYSYSYSLCLGALLLGQLAGRGAALARDDLVHQYISIYR
ncbi:hypothetical protein JYU34_006258 [Plutella xylostella]|uniref:Uncharacterized protein n=1 Tax=Plutella xylostella TaxID=51655 RepID=A0ABQ7QRP3_PLUXY|nr:hypothetical protein JYU34_006258 [Plutella xylostella]